MSGGGYRQVLAARGRSISAKDYESSGMDGAGEDSPAVSCTSGTSALHNFVLRESSESDSSDATSASTTTTATVAATSAAASAERDNFRAWLADQIRFSQALSASGALDGGVGSVFSRIDSSSSSQSTSVSPVVSSPSAGRRPGLLQRLARVTSRRCMCSFSLHVHGVDSLPEAFEGRELVVQWRRSRGVAVSTSPAAVRGGVAKVEQSLQLSCTLFFQQGPRGTLKFQPKPSTLTVWLLDDGGGSGGGRGGAGSGGRSGMDLEIGSHLLDLGRVVPSSMHDSDGSAGSVRNGGGGGASGMLNSGSKSSPGNASTSSLRSSSSRSSSQVAVNAMAGGGGAEGLRQPGTIMFKLGSKANRAPLVATIGYDVQISRGGDRGLRTARADSRAFRGYSLPGSAQTSPGSSPPRSFRPLPVVVPGQSLPARGVSPAKSPGASGGGVSGGALVPRTPTAPSVPAAAAAAVAAADKVLSPTGIVQAGVEKALNGLAEEVGENVLVADGEGLGMSFLRSANAAAAATAAAAAGTADSFGGGGTSSRPATAGEDPSIDLRVESERERPGSGQDPAVALADPLEGQGGQSEVEREGQRRVEASGADVGGMEAESRFAAGAGSHADEVDRPGDRGSKPVDVGSEATGTRGSAAATASPSQTNNGPETVRGVKQVVEVIELDDLVEVEDEEEDEGGVRGSMSEGGSAKGRAGSAAASVNAGGPAADTDVRAMKGAREGRVRLGTAGGGSGAWDLDQEMEAVTEEFLSLFGSEGQPGERGDPNGVLGPDERGGGGGKGGGADQGVRDERDGCFKVVVEEVDEEELLQGLLGLGDESDSEDEKGSNGFKKGGGGGDGGLKRANGSSGSLLLGPWPLQGIPECDEEGEEEKQENEEEVQALV